MADELTDKVREFIMPIQGRDIDLNYLRKELRIDPESSAWDYLRVVLFRLVGERKLRPSGKRDGVYRVITQVQPVPIFSITRERRPPFDLRFPRDFDTGMEMAFGEAVVIREGDLILVSGLSNFGKTLICLSFAGENIDQYPVLMGNEYTTLVEGEYVPSPRFINRLEAMEGIE